MISIDLYCYDCGFWDRYYGETRHAAKENAEIEGWSFESNGERVLCPTCADELDESEMEDES
jgi:hypothetical protein